jgi:hypothetical protein
MEWQLLIWFKDIFIARRRDEGEDGDFDKRIN